MQEFANLHSLRNGIFDLLSSVNIATKQNTELLDYTIGLFNKNGLSSDYYGYHNIDHELEVTYVTLISAIHSLKTKKCPSSKRHISANWLELLWTKKYIQFCGT